MKDVYESVRDTLVEYTSNTDIWTSIIFAVLKIGVIWFGGRILVSLVHRAIQHMLEQRDKRPGKHDTRRAKTIAKLAKNIISYVINFVVIMLILSQMGFNLMPLLAGAGVVGLAIGFGAQNLVKDVITGFFIIFEDQFAVGDVIQTGSFKGTVEEIGLRVTKIRNWTGEVHIIPNGSIVEVTNFSINNSIGVVDVSIAYEADIDQAMQVIKDTALNVYRGQDDVVKEPDVLGVQSLGASEVVIRVTMECKPNTQFAVARKMNAEIKKALDQVGIEIPYPRLVTFQRTETAG